MSASQPTPTPQGRPRTAQRNLPTTCGAVAGRSPAGHERRTGARRPHPHAPVVVFRMGPPPIRNVPSRPWRDRTRRSTLVLLSIGAVKRKEHRMVARIRTLTASLGFVVLGIIVAGPPSATTALAATTAPEREGAVGADNGMWLRGNTPPGPWLSFGGVLLGPPALASLPSESQTPQQGSPFVVATGADHRLWTFNQQQGWQPLTSSPTFCIDNPTAVVTSAHASGMQLLTVACPGGAHALWFPPTTI